MSFSLSIQIARTHLLSRKKQTAIASLGVTFGIAMFILMISFMTGVNKVLEDTALTSAPHIHIFQDPSTQSKGIVDQIYIKSNQWNIIQHPKPRNELPYLKNGLLIAESIRQNPDVFGVSPQVSTQVFFNYGPVQITGVLLGVNILEEDHLYNVRSKIKAGSIEALMASRDGILMGKGLADKMHVQVGDRVSVATPRGNTQMLRIVGLFKFGIGTIDNMRCYTNTSTVQRIIQKDKSYITDLHIKMHDLSLAKKTAAQYEARFGYKSEDWDTANASILVSFTIRNVLTYVVVATLLVVAGFGIYNIMNMTIYDKIKDIAILKATGFESSDIISIFLFEAVFIGVAGGVLGLILGFILSYGLSLMPFDGGEFLSIETFPVSFNIMFYVSGISFGIITTFFAGYFPAKKASKVDPVAILRG